MTYEQTIDFLFNQLANYHKQGQQAYKPGLDNIRAFCNRLGNPQDSFKSIHIAGTNGKGSVSHICASVLQEAGYQVGLFTSPHFLDFRERVKINGAEIPENYVIKFVSEHKAFAISQGITFFEWTTALAFEYFKDKDVDIAIIETGLGGRLDSTNILNSDVQIITTIGLDHTEMLGETIEEIALEKAGIIKPNGIVIIGQGNPSLLPIFEQKVNQYGALMYVASSTNDFLEDSDLHGEFQKANLNTAFTLFDIQLRHQTGSDRIPFSIKPEHLTAGFANVKRNTGLKGRWQSLGQNPTIVLDIAHNAQAVKAAMNQLKNECVGRAHIVFGCMKDKDLAEITPLLPKHAYYYAVSVNHLRALPAKTLQGELLSAALQCTYAGNVTNGIAAARNSSRPSDFILICGSAYVVAEALQEFF